MAYHIASHWFVCELVVAINISMFLKLSKKIFGGGLIYSVMLVLENILIGLGASKTTTSLFFSVNKIYRYKDTITINGTDLTDFRQ